MMQETVLSICLGIGLAASVGFRVFLPLLAVSIAGHYGLIPLNGSWEWVGSSLSILILAIATFAEIVAYYIPWFDNLLDTIAIPLAAVAGTAVMVSTMSDMSPVVTWALAIIAGGGTAATVKSTMGASRLTSTATTGGVANPLIATVETGTATVLSITSVILPFLAIILVLLLFIGLRKIYKKLFFRSS
ncbi:DUF4126 domain-containing protein [Aquimarina sp. 2201CG5-10]|uniref:DUF4126 domain-containing protein n=1 Tax=Aquimarina callyspongiae TaxID=3098150 RepID=UPI002AB527F7|nr:DUF4126 domain-containing protein [Aquimarina sp. 2201CG5-10]MDY8136402.1 DUF4126 domain-containing protein [Aquimarina sp. 2201CG5-10]